MIPIPIISVTPNENSFDYTRSVKKWWYDDRGGGGQYAQPIRDTYFEAAKFPQSINRTFKVETYTWNCNSLDSGNNSEINFYYDLSDKVISVTYDCDSSNNIKISASLTLLIPPEDDFWYANREYDIRSTPLPSSSSGGITSNGQANAFWIPQLYFIKEIFEFKNSKPKCRTKNLDFFDDDKIYTFPENCERVLGFFIPESTGYTYDTTTNQLTIQLQGLSAAFTAENGGKVISPIASHSYYFDMPYNSRPTSIPSYRIEERKTETDSDKTEKTTIQKPVPKTKEEEEKERIRSAEKGFYDQFPNDGINGVVFGTAPVANESAPVDGNVKVSAAPVNVPMPISISGEENGLFKVWDIWEIGRIIYNFAMCRTDATLNTYHMPLTQYCAPVASYLGEKSVIFPNGWDFENGISVMDIAEKMLGDMFYEPKLWVDEDRRLCIFPYPLIPEPARCNYIPYRYYSNLVISEDISFNDNDFYTVTEVYGKNNEYYGVCDASWGFSFKTPIENTSDSYRKDLNIPVVSAIPKVQVITDDSLESDEECYERALYENWKASRGHTKITIKLSDNFIPDTSRMSLIAGKEFVEYRCFQGDKRSDRKSMVCILTKASLSDNIWTWELEPFSSFAPAYDWFNIGVYQRFRSEHYDEWIGAKFRNNRFSEEGLTLQESNTLTPPSIIGYEIIDNKLRLYISGVDIGLGVVKVWTGSHSGSYNESEFLGEAVDTNGTGKLPWGTPPAENISDIQDGKHIYKVFEIPIRENGEMSFVVSLYNPLHESGVSSPQHIYISGVTVTDPETGEIRKPYLKDELGNILTDENGNKFTV